MCNVEYIDKIRYMANGSMAYIDIYYSASVSNSVVVCFDVKTGPSAQQGFVASGPTAVAESPSGETELALYSFAKNTNAELAVTYVSNSYVDSAAVGRLHFWIRGDVIVCLFNLGSVSSMATGTDFVKIGTVALPKSLSAGFYTNVPAQNGSGTLLVQIAANGDISIANASGATASGFYRTTISLVMV